MKRIQTEKSVHQIITMAKENKIDLYFSFDDGNYVYFYLNNNMYIKKGIRGSLFHKKVRNAGGKLESGLKNYYTF